MALTVIQESTSQRLQSASPNRAISPRTPRSNLVLTPYLVCSIRENQKIMILSVPDREHANASFIELPFARDSHIRLLPKRVLMDLIERYRASRTRQSFPRVIDMSRAVPMTLLFQHPLPMKDEAVAAIENTKGLQRAMTFDLGRGEVAHQIAADNWRRAERLRKALPYGKIVGLTLGGPESLIEHLPPRLVSMMLRVPTVATALDIAFGDRLNLSDCLRECIDLPRSWNGRVRVEEVQTDAGDTRYQVLALRPVPGGEWLCDSPSLCESVDFAALLQASAKGLIQEMTAKRKSAY